MTHTAGQHSYTCTVSWTGNRGTGTSGYRDYDRTHETTGPDGKPSIAGSSDPVFRGDTSRWNPEELLVASLASCHMLVFLHRAAVSGVVVTDYSDAATGVMQEDGEDGGRFVEVTLRPTVTVKDAGMAQKCDDLHTQAHAGCYIASSVNFPVQHQATTLLG